VTAALAIHEYGDFRVRENLVRFAADHESRYPAPAVAVGYPDSVRAPAREAVLASRTCPVCLKTPLTARQEVCSGGCRAARSRQRKAKARRARDAEIRALLEAALNKLRKHE
jgi:predicted nucleic acid-binding Zn ribbon protein